MAGDWFRVTHWDAQAAEDFEKRLARSRAWSRAQYLRVQGVTLWGAGSLGAAKGLLQRVVQQHAGDDLEAAAATEHLGEIGLEEGDLPEAQAQFRSLLSRWPDLNGTAGTAEMALADVLSRQESASAHVEAVELLERFLDRDDSVRWASVMFRWHMVRLRLAEHQGDHHTAARHAADALQLAGEGPLFPRHEDVGVVHADEVTLQRLRRVAGPSPVGTGAPYGRASVSELQDREEEEALLEELAGVGLDVADFYALDAKVPGYERALPILMRHLQDESYPEVFRSDIARAMGTTLAGPLWQGMVDCYYTQAPGSLVRDGLAVALSEAATKDHLVQVVGLLNDQEWGQDRLYFLRTLTRLRHPDRWELIASLTDDPHIGAEATRMLNRRRT